MGGLNAYGRGKCIWVGVNAYRSGEMQIDRGKCMLGSN